MKVYWLIFVVVVVNHHLPSALCEVVENETISLSNPRPLTRQAGSVNRIYGGHEVVPHSIPWQVGVFTTSAATVPTCGGVLISENHVLTAAHCTIGQHPKYMHVVLGDHDTQSDTDSVTISRDISRNLVHPNYVYTGSFGKIEHDITILFLKDPVDVGTFSNIKIVCLPTNPKENYLGEKLVASGWGRETQNGELSRVLRAVEVTVINKQKCREFFNAVPYTMICAGKGEMEEGTVCLGDSGGPLTHTKSGITTLVGLSSLVLKPCEISTIGATRVAVEMPWIRKETGL